MQGTIPLWQSDPLQYLVNKKYPLLAFWQSKATSGSLNENDKNLLQEAIEFRKQLELKSLDDIALLVKPVRDHEVEQLRLSFEALENGRFYNQPNANVDFNYWSRISYWTLEEGVALSLGKNPSIVNAEKIAPYRQVLPFAALFMAKLEEVKRAKAMGQLFATTIPILFIKWAERIGFEFPEELELKIRALGAHVRDWKDAYEAQIIETQKYQAETKRLSEKALQLLQDRSLMLDKTSNSVDDLLAKHDRIVAQRDNTIVQLQNSMQAMANEKSASESKSISDLAPRERESLLKLILGMAIEGYGYDSKASRNSQTQEIANDLLKAGLPLDVDTVRKYLNEAKALFSDELNRAD